MGLQGQAVPADDGEDVIIPQGTDGGAVQGGKVLLKPGDGAAQGQSGDGVAMRPRHREALHLGETAGNVKADALGVRQQAVHVEAHGADHTPLLSRAARAASMPSTAALTMPPA